jgi:hypothetical protein
MVAELKFWSLCPLSTGTTTRVENPSGCLKKLAFDPPPREK